MALTSEELLLAKSRLLEAEQALHRLSIGKAVAEVVDQNGEKVRYTTANRSSLIAYIDELKALIAGTRRTAKPLRPYFA